MTEHSSEKNLSSSLNTWKQWLLQLNKLQDNSLSQVQFEALELILNSPINSAQFYTRLGTLLSKAFDPEPIIIVAEESNPLYVSLENNKTAQLFSKVKLPSLKQESLQERRVRPPLSFDFTPLPINSRYSLSLSGGDEKRITLFILSSSALQAEAKNFLHFIEKLLDYREQSRNISRQLLQEQNRLSALTHHLSEGFVVLDSTMRIALWNRPLQRLTGYNLKESLGKPYRQVLRRSDGTDLIDDLIKLYEPDPSRNAFNEEFQIETKRKEKRWIQISGSFLRGSDSKINQTIAIIRDISHVKKLEERKNEFISIATHELRTPITAIKGYLSLLEKQSESFNEKQLLYLRRAEEANERLIRLAEELLQVSHIEEDRLQLNLRPVSLAEIIKKICNDFNEKASKKGIALICSEPDFQTTVIADPLRVEQVFSNLVDNAVKYTTKGEVRVFITQGKKRVTEERIIIVSVKDTGIGMDSHDISGIFEKFHRTKSATETRESGAGLGLYIVKSFIEMQGGTINVSSKLHKGSLFSVSFPAVDEKEDRLEKKDTSKKLARKAKNEKKSTSN
jgi:PAS domain S-box-containing protein